MRDASGGESRLMANSPASEVILLPWNSSFWHRSKSTRRGPGFAPPIGQGITAPQHRHKILILISESVSEVSEIAVYLENPG
jgi:hypothetical protein